MSRIALLALVTAAFCASSTPLPSVAAVTSGHVTSIRVTAREFSFKLSRKSAPIGTIRFTVTNAGQIPHDFVIAGKKTRLLDHGQTASLVIQVRKAANLAYRCSVSGHAAVGMKGRLVVGKPPPIKPPPTTVPPVSHGVTLFKVGKFDAPVFVTSPPGDQHTVLVVEQRGVIDELIDGVLLDRPFLDIRRYVYGENETGLLSLAFAPDYATSGLFYVYFNDPVANHNVNVVEFRRSTADPLVADPDSYRQVLLIQKPWADHNGGMMKFGPDGYLYVSVGDGDSGVLDAPGAFAQTLDDLLGSILRIDPSLQADGAAYGVPADNPFVGFAGARPEIWAYGLRNPWRFDIDPLTGDLYLGDVGEGTEEEIDEIPASTGGLNFGWPCFEGKTPYDKTQTCANAVPPALSYGHAQDRCAIIAGVVARDPRLPDLAGRILYSDFCGGEIRRAQFKGGSLIADGPVGATVPVPGSFGEDGLERIYVTSLADGTVYRLDPAP